MLKVGLTGGIASGKSTVASMLEHKGAYVIDLDELAHRVEEPGKPAWMAIVNHFGNEILNDDNTINRKKLGEIVFADREKLSLLNSIVHPYVFEEWERKVEEIRSRDPQAIVISDVPLLIETGMHSRMDVVVLVYAQPEDQIKRLMERNGISREVAIQRLSSQMPIDAKVPYAHFVIDNRRTIEDTRVFVDTVWEELRNWETSK